MSIWRVQYRASHKRTPTLSADCKMAVVTIITCLVIAGLGGAGIYAIIEGTGGSKGPDISNSTIGNMEYDARSKQAIIGIDVDLRKSGFVTEMIIVCAIAVLGSLCCIYQCCRREARMTHGMCFHDSDERRWRIRRAARREKFRNKKIIDHNRKKLMRQARHEAIQEMEDLTHAQEIKKLDEIEANKISKMNELRPTMMSNKSFAVRSVPTTDPEDSPSVMQAKPLECDLEAGSSISSSSSDLSVYTENPLSECSYIQISHV